MCCLCNPFGYCRSRFVAHFSTMRACFTCRSGALPCCTPTPAEDCFVFVCSYSLFFLPLLSVSPHTWTSSRRLSACFSRMIWTLLPLLATPCSLLRLVELSP